MLEQQEDVRRIRVGWELEDGDLLVSVRDDGPGELASEGLALHALTDRARAVEGELNVESVPGWGSNLRARLPVGPVRDAAAPPAPPRPAPRPPPPPAPPSGRNPRVCKRRTPSPRGAAATARSPRSS